MLWNCCVDVFSWGLSKTTEEQQAFSAVRGMPYASRCVQASQYRVRVIAPTRGRAMGTWVALRLTPALVAPPPFSLSRR